MSIPLVALENETFPGRKRWTRKECEHLIKIGVLTGRFELIDGEIVSEMSQNPPHSVTLNRFFRWLVLLFGIDFVRNQEDIAIPGRNARSNGPQPDIAVTTRHNDDYAANHPSPSEIVLLVEIFDSTLSMDKTTKALLYAQSGVREYWVGNIAKREVIRHRRPKRTGYAEIVTLGEDDLISPEARLENSVRVGDLFPLLAEDTK